MNRNKLERELRKMGFQSHESRQVPGETVTVTVWRKYTNDKLVAQIQVATKWFYGDQLLKVPTSFTVSLWLISDDDGNYQECTVDGYRSIRRHLRFASNP